MKLKVFIGLDLGSDTLKIAYSYISGGKVRTGKIVRDVTSMSAVPSVAYYDFDEKKWLFGEDVDGVGDKSFISVVKIKYLLSLLDNKCAPPVNESNAAAYFNCNHFPKFYFPERKKLSSDYRELIADNAAFFVEGSTPESVCEGFFAYVAELIKERAALLAEREGADDAEIIPSIIYPQFSSKTLISELERLVGEGFKTPSFKTLSATKSLCAYAMLSGRIKAGESVLIFDIGEEKTSVVKASLLKTGMAIDGADGHNDPCALGGNDIDDAVADYLERSMSRRESMGRPSAGNDGYLAEGSLNSKQYLFAKDIKSAKAILGMFSYDKFFSGGVPVCVSRDLYVQRRITREAFEKCVGTPDGSSFAKKLAEYINEELTRPVNRDVKKIFLSGGPVETYGLTEYIRKTAAEFGAETLTFENSGEEPENDGFNVLSYEDALYAPSLGCALSALKDIDIKTVLALSYGLRLFLYEGEVPYLELLVNRGDVLPPEGASFFTPRPGDMRGLTTSRDSEKSAQMIIMSTVLTREDIAQRKYFPHIMYSTTSNGGNYLKCDLSDKKLMSSLSEYAGLKLLGGDDGAGAIYYYYNKTRVRLLEKVYAKIGVKIDGEGRAVPFAENDKVRNGTDTVTITYKWDIRKNGVTLRRAGDREVVYKRDIQFDFDLGEMIFS